MFKNYQLIHLLGRTEPSTYIYAATTIPKSNSNNGTLTYTSNNNNNTTLSKKEFVTIRITDVEELRDSQLILNEINATKSIRHSNILPLLNCFVKDSQVWLVYPFMYYGSCREILNSINNLNNLETNNGQIDIVDEQKRLCFNEQSLQIISKSILNALDYLHNKYVIHRCICPDNIYINQNGQVFLSGLNYCISLIDQGTLFKKLHDYPNYYEDYLNYLSPEILKQNLIGYNTKSDIYSFGVTLCELANGVNPFVGCEKAQMLYEKLAGLDIGLWDRNILTSEICVNENSKVVASVQRRFYTDKFRNFVDLCVELNLEYRPTASQLLEHSFIKKFKQSHNIQSIFQMSVMADGLIERQKKNEKTIDSTSSSKKTSLFSNEHDNLNDKMTKSESNSMSYASSNSPQQIQWNF